MGPTIDRIEKQRRRNAAILGGASGKCLAKPAIRVSDNPSGTPSSYHPPLHKEGRKSPLLTNLFIHDKLQLFIESKQAPTEPFF